MDTASRNSPATSAPALLHVCPGDLCPEEITRALTRNHGLQPLRHPDGASALRSLERDQGPCVLLTGAVLPDMTAVELMQSLTQAGTLPTTIVAAEPEELRSAASAVLGGAWTLLERPLALSDVDAAVSQAIDELDRTAQERQVRAEAREQLRDLSARERQVLTLLAVGSVTKEVARQLGLSTKTVENHRAKIMRKVGVKTPVALARVAWIAAGGAFLDTVALDVVQDERVRRQLKHAVGASHMPRTHAS